MQSPVFLVSLTVTECDVYFSSMPPWFWFVQLEVVERNRCVCICRKTESANHSSIAFDSSECIWLRPDKAWVYIGSDSVELFVHTWCLASVWVCLDGLWHDGKFHTHTHPIHSSLSAHLPPWQSHSSAVGLGLELVVKGEGCVGPEATDVSLWKGQTERMSLGLKSLWHRWSYIHTLPNLDTSYCMLSKWEVHVNRLIGCSYSSAPLQH